MCLGAGWAVAWAGGYRVLSSNTFSGVCDVVQKGAGFVEVLHMNRALS